jgi:anti-anti-sigma regulatory factor
MQNAFKILIHRNETCLHLKLHGEFDAMAAQELLDILKRRGRKRSRVFIHTSGLSRVQPFGTAVFKDRCAGLVDKSVSLIFTGEHAHRLAPRGSTQI